VHAPPDWQDWQQILEILYEMGIQHLAVLGGGTLVASLVEQNVIDELHLTVCPLLLGGRHTPTPVDGVGLPIALATKLELIQVKTAGDEVFLHYRRCHPKRD
jgi:5-amino-6-(5-phosphoribosylamino)uracil reductase